MTDTPLAPLHYGLGEKERKFLDALAKIERDQRLLLLNRDRVGMHRRHKAAQGVAERVEILASCAPMQARSIILPRTSWRPLRPEIPLLLCGKSTRSASGGTDWLQKQGYFEARTLARLHEVPVGLLRRVRG